MAAFVGGKETWLLVFWNERQNAHGEISRRSRWHSGRLILVAEGW